MRSLETRVPEVCGWLREHARSARLLRDWQLKRLVYWVLDELPEGPATLDDVRRYRRDLRKAVPGFVRGELRVGFPWWVILQLVVPMLIDWILDWWYSRFATIEHG